MMTKRDQALLVSLYRSETWEAVNRVIADLSLSWQIDAQSDGTEWVYLRNSLIRDGRIGGMKMLMKEIERLVSKSL